MRLMIGMLFVAGGYSHLEDPGSRGRSIGKGKGFTIFLGIAESDSFSSWWAPSRKKSSYGTPGSGVGKLRVGDLLFAVMNLVILIINGGAHVRLR